MFLNPYERGIEMTVEEKMTTETGGENGEESKVQTEGATGEGIKEENSRGEEESRKSSEPRSVDRDSKAEPDPEEDLIKRPITPMSTNYDMSDFQKGVNNSKGNMQSKEDFNVFKKV